MHDTRVAAILVAAGLGKRLGAAEPKQFAELGGRALLTHALRTLSTSVHVVHVVVVLPVGWEERARTLCAAAGLDLVHTTWIAGGATRQESVHRGLQALPDATHVLVHDAARPFLTATHIERTVHAARQHDAATLALPVTDTLLRAAPEHDGAAQATQHVERRGMWAIQTPQVFERTLLEQAHERARADHAQATDDGTLVLALGRTVVLVEGNWWNLKITTPDDFERARWILDSGFTTRRDTHAGVTAPPRTRGTREGGRR